MIKWEYLQEMSDADKAIPNDKMSVLRANGWELVDIYSTPNKYNLLYVFKLLI